MLRTALPNGRTHPRCVVVSVAIAALCGLVGSGCIVVPAGETKTQSATTTAPRASEPRTFPRTRQKLAEADATADDPARAEPLYREAIALAPTEAKVQRGEYVELVARAHAGLGNSLFAQARSEDALGDMATLQLMAADATWKDYHQRLTHTFPAAFQGYWVKPVYPLVIDDLTSKETLDMLERELPKSGGVVVQRVHVTNVKVEGTTAKLSVVGKNHSISSQECRAIGTLTIERQEYMVKRCETGKPTAFIGATLEIRVPATEATRAKLEAGEIDWISFDASAIRHSGNTWSVGNGHLILVQ